LNNLQSTLACLQPLSDNATNPVPKVTATIPVTPVREPVRRDTDNVSKPAESVSEVIPSMAEKTKKVFTHACILFTCWMPDVSIYSQEFSFPHNQANPYLTHATLSICAHLTRTGGFKMTNSFQAHECGISRLVDMF